MKKHIPYILCGLLALQVGNVSATARKERILIGSAIACSAAIALYCGYNGYSGFQELHKNQTQMEELLREKFPDITAEVMYNPSSVDYSQLPESFIPYFVKITLLDSIIKDTAFKAGAFIIFSSCAIALSLQWACLEDAFSRLKCL